MLQCLAYRLPCTHDAQLLVQFCAHAIAIRLRVLIRCPTGHLVATYRQRLPDVDFNRIETMHAGLDIYREKDALVEHAPPSTLRKYDAILLDECSQIDNSTARKVVYAIDELPQKPFVAIAADYRQLQPVRKGGCMASMCNRKSIIYKKITIFS